MALSETSEVEMPAKGTCLCGAVTITAAEAGDKLVACHCEMCTTWGGGPLLAVHCGKEVQIDGAESVGVFDSSAWAERGFCKTCGTHLFYRLKEQQSYNVPLGLFRGAVQPTFAMQFFVDRKSPCYSFADKTRMLTEAEVFEMFAPRD